LLGFSKTSFVILSTIFSGVELGNETLFMESESQLTYELQYSQSDDFSDFQ